MKRIGWLVIVSLVLGLMVPGIGIVGRGEIVGAQEWVEVDVAVTGAATIRGPDSNTPNTDTNYQTSEFFNEGEWVDNPSPPPTKILAGEVWRMLYRVGDQSGGGEVKKVELHIYYKNKLTGLSPSGRSVTVSRLTREPVMTEVTWNEWKDGSAWTSTGGDTTSYQRVWYSHPANYGWVVVDVTDMALYQFDLGKDLYLMVDWTERSDTDEGSWVQYGSRLDANTNIRPFVRVFYEEAPVPPEIGAEVDRVGDTWVELELSPKLYGEASANITGQVSVAGAGNWSCETNYGVVTSDAKVIVKVEGLTGDTEYDFRGKLVYDDGGDQTVYSAVGQFETVAWIMPALYVTEDDVGWGEFDATVGYTGNDSAKTVKMGLRWRDSSGGVTGWTYGGYVWRTAVNSSWSQTIDGLGLYGEVYEVQGVYEIEGQVFYSEAEFIQVLRKGQLRLTLEDKGGDWVEFGLNWTLEEGGALTYIEVEVTGGGVKVVSDRITTGLDGDGEDTILVFGLVPGTEYFAKGIAKHGTGEYNGYLLPYGTTFYTTDIDVVPEVVTLDGLASDDGIRFRASVTFNDAAYITKHLYFKYRVVGGTSWMETEWEEITTEGTHEIVVTGLLSQKEYEVVAWLDYVVGKVEGGTKVVWVPAWEPRLRDLRVGVRGTTAYFSVYYDGHDMTSTMARFHVTNKEDSTWVRSEWLTVSAGMRVEWSVELDADTVYEVMAQTKYMGTEAVEFKTGWSLSAYLNSIAGGWVDFSLLRMLFGLLIAIGAGALIAFKLRESGGWQIGLFAAFGLTLFFGFIGWFPVWIILLLTMMLGLGLLWSFKGVSAPG